MPNPGLFGRVSRDDCRRAVAQAIRQAKASRGLSNEALADKLGVSEKTVANAENERGTLDLVTLLNIACTCGGLPAIRPVMALISGCVGDEPTALDRLERIEAEAAMLRREMER